MVTIRPNDPDPAVLDGRNIRASAFEPAQRQLAAQLQGLFDPRPTTRRTLTVNAGYSPLPTVLTDHGFAVEGADLCAAAIEEAQTRYPSIEQQLIDRPEHLPYSDNSFDLVWCIDTVEHADHPEALISELARVTSTGGRIVLDTLNNTFLSRLVYLRLFQQVPGTKIMPAHRYRADRFRTPDQLSGLCRAAGLDVERIVGYEPASAGTLITSLLARRRGRITDRELAANAGFRLPGSGHPPPVTYYVVSRKHGERSGAG